MKTSSVYCLTARKAPLGVTRKPLLSARELAREFGVSVPVLRGFLSQSTSAPKPVFSRANGDKTSYYDPDVMRAWWAASNRETA